MIKTFIDYIKNNKISSSEAIELLKNDPNLSRDDKNLIYAYCFPRQLLDRELPFRIKLYRDKFGYSHLQVDSSEVSLIVEASQTEQYKRYIKHLMYSFSDASKVNPVNNINEDDENPRCGICDCELLYYDKWNSRVPDFSEEYKDRELLAFGSTESGIILCKHCLLHLISAINIINNIDPGFLDYTKRVNNKI